MVENQLELFLIFITNGIIIGILFDIFRVLRKTFKTNDIVTYLEDILFWILTGIIILYSIFTFNSGEIRLFMFLAICIGATIYLFLFSSYFIKINVTILNILKNIILKIIKIIGIPFKYIYMFIRKIFFKPISFIIINLRKNSTNLYKHVIKNIKKPKKIEKNIKI